MKYLLLPSAFLLLFLGACTTARPVVTGSAGDSGIPVAGEFTAFYEENGGERIFGHPITEGFVVEEDGRLIQYFQAMRLEYDQAAQAVSIFPMGEWALAGLNNPEPVPVPENSPSRHFAETDLAIQDEFLTFYEAYNGEQLLGPPISPQLDEGDLRVQYFRNGRLEWRPELPTEQRIQVSYLGQAHFDAEMAFTYRKNQLARPVSFAGLARVDVFTSVQAAVLYNGDQQTLFVTILTPEGRPVAGISADVTAIYGDTTRTIDLGQTDGEGRIVAALPSFNAPPGQQVELETFVYSAGGEVIGSSMVTFKTWW